jgi:hypothetical protein
VPLVRIRLSCGLASVVEPIPMLDSVCPLIY